MSDRDRASPTLIETGLKTFLRDNGRDSNYPLISGTNGKYLKQFSVLCVMSV